MIIKIWWKLRTKRLMKTVSYWLQLWINNFWIIQRLTSSNATAMFDLDFYDIQKLEGHYDKFSNKYENYVEKLQRKWRKNNKYFLKTFLGWFMFYKKLYFIFRIILVMVSVYNKNEPLSQKLLILLSFF